MLPSGIWGRFVAEPREIAAGFDSALRWVCQT
jgi:hypothetical protein